jgi:hypothetical protein
MSMKNDLKLLEASAMLFLNDSRQFYDTPRAINHVPKTPSKGELKKCKSCKHFPCPESKTPMRIACGNHERRKRK